MGQGSENKRKLIFQPQIGCIYSQSLLPRHQMVSEVVGSKIARARSGG